MCPPIEPERSQITIAANSGLHPVLLNTGNPGLFVYVNESEARRLHFSLRARDTSRTAFTAGTEIPVVRHDEWVQTRIVLANIPPRENFTHLRIYSSPATSVDIEFRRHRDSTLLGTAVAEIRENGRIHEPEYAEVRDFPQNDSPMYVIIRSRNQAALWGFISLTNNSSQEITAITPQ